MSAILEFHFHIWSQSCHSFQHFIKHGYTKIVCKSDHCRRSYHVISISKMAAAVAQVYFRFRTGWSCSLYKIKVYRKTKFRWNNSIHGWDITISGLEKQTPAILKFCFRFRPRPHRRNRHVILHQPAKFNPNQTILGRVMMSGRFSRWRPLWRNFTSGLRLGQSLSLEGQPSISNQISWG